MKGYCKIIPIDVYNRDVLFVFGDINYLRKSIRKYHTKEQTDTIIANSGITEHSRGLTIYSEQYNAFVLWQPHLPTTAEDLGFLSHEIFHATNALMKNIGADLCLESEEAYAYLIGFLTKRVLKEFPISFCENGQVLGLTQTLQES